jgi:hypothetical protein
MRRFPRESQEHARAGSFFPARHLTRQCGGASRFRTMPAMALSRSRLTAGVSSDPGRRRGPCRGLRGTGPTASRRTRRRPPGAGRRRRRGRPTRARQARKSTASRGEARSRSRPAAGAPRAPRRPRARASPPPPATRAARPTGAVAGAASRSRRVRRAQARHLARLVDTGEPVVEPELVDGVTGLDEGRAERRRALDGPLLLLSFRFEADGQLLGRRRRAVVDALFAPALRAASRSRVSFLCSLHTNVEVSRRERAPGRIPGSRTGKRSLRGCSLQAEEISETAVVAQRPPRECCGMLLG